MNFLDDLLTLFRPPDCYHDVVYSLKHQFLNFTAMILLFEYFITQSFE